MITLPLTFTDSLVATVETVATDVMPLIILGVGLPLGFYIVRKVMGVLRAR